MERVPMTAVGQKKLQDELEHLKNIKRPQIIEEIQKSLAHGDLSENSEYKYAKEKQSFIEGRIVQIEDQLNRAQVIDISKLSGDSVKFGATVTLQNEETKKISKYQIVGEDEANLENQLISYKTPIVTAMMNKKKNDSVVVNTPRGAQKYTIINIEFIRPEAHS